MVDNEEYDLALTEKDIGYTEEQIKQMDEKEVKAYLFATKYVLETANQNVKRFQKKRALLMKRLRELTPEDKTIEKAYQNLNCIDRGCDGDLIFIGNMKKDEDGKTNDLLSCEACGLQILMPADYNFEI